MFYVHGVFTELDSTEGKTNVYRVSKTPSRPEQFCICSDVMLVLAFVLMDYLMTNFKSLSVSLEV